MAEIEVGLPQILLETVHHQQGLIGLSGDLRSNLSELIQPLLLHLQEKKPVLVCSENGSFFDGLKSAFAVPAVAEFAGEANRILRDAEVIFVEGDFLPSRFDFYLNLAEEGRLVVWCQRVPTNIHFLRKLLSLSWGEARSHKVWRIADQLQLLLAQCVAPKLEGKGSVAVHELFLMTPALRLLLQHEDISGIEELLQKSEDGSGLVSMNQSLLQLLLRRKIDVKTAFSLTRDPSHLDLLLKKAGV